MTRKAAQVLCLMVLAYLALACSAPFDNPLTREPEATANPSIVGFGIGPLVTTGAIESETSRPLDARSRFLTAEPAIYVVAEIRRIEQGTNVFARWFYEGEPLLDSQSITADRVYEENYLQFRMETVAGTTLEPGNYSVQLFVNGFPGPSVEFIVE